MLQENLKNLRKAKGLSQEELAVKLNVVRQTVSKWEQGLSVPDAEMLITLSEVLGAPVSTLLGETVTEPEASDLRAVSEKLEVLNLQLAREKERRRKRRHGLFIGLAVLIVLIFGLLWFLQSPYLNWDFTDPELAVAGTLMHGFEFVFVRIAPFALAASVAGAVLTRKKD